MSAMDPHQGAAKRPLAGSCIDRFPLWRRFLSRRLNGIILQDAEIRDGVRHPEAIAPADPQRRDQVHLLALHFGHAQLSRASPHIHDCKIIRERHRQLVHRRLVLTRRRKLWEVPANRWNSAKAGVSPARIFRRG